MSLLFKTNVFLINFSVICLLLKMRLNIIMTFVCIANSYRHKLTIKYHKLRHDTNDRIVEQVVNIMVTDVEVREFKCLVNRFITRCNRQRDYSTKTYEKLQEQVVPSI